jgi:hypothetical protein
LEKSIILEKKFLFYKNLMIQSNSNIKSLFKLNKFAPVSPYCKNTRTENLIALHYMHFMSN